MTMAGRSQAPEGVARPEKPGQDPAPVPSNGHSTGTAAPRTLARQGRERRAPDGISGRCLSLRGAARYLGISPRTLRYMLENGTLRRVCPPSPYGNGEPVRRILIDRADLDELISRWKGQG